MFGRHAMVVNEDERACGNEYEDAAQAAPADNDVKQERPVAEQAEIIGVYFLQDQCVMILSARFLQEQGYQHGDRQGQSREQVEIHSPAEQYVDIAAQQGGERRRKRGSHAVDSHRAHLFLLGKQVPDDGKHHDAFHRGRDALEHPRNQQLADVGGNGAQETGEGETGHAPEQHRPPAEAFRERAVDKGGQAVGQQVEANRELDQPRTRAQQFRQMGQARRVQVRGHKGDDAGRDDQREDDVPVHGSPYYIL